MAHQDDIVMMAHLMRRAGFGATRDEQFADAWRQLLCEERALGDFVGPDLE